MDKENDHSVRIISPNQEDRLEVVAHGAPGWDPLYPEDTMWPKMT